jgi:hypothetical protein
VLDLKIMQGYASYQCFMISKNLVKDNQVKTGDAISIKNHEASGSDSRKQKLQLRQLDMDVADF